MRKFFIRITPAPKKSAGQKRPFLDETLPQRRF
jgi:hypothetical protein